ncbi:hypothetical protein PMAYCL1PPCAC_09806 [Pristionchus mayeri]|uniref:Uncharacterized protein n=1 Tax=Pristionchus mayeri TaxID=1317129 RepID=A0AAN4ZIB3_9BILA|nr:hypothetical protein PMAYCL1PPCAC_09806 [Pristionchus mayeri]
METTIVQQYWQELESCVQSDLQGRDRYVMDGNKLVMMFNNVMEEKKRMETEQIISRLMHNRNPPNEKAYNLEEAKETLRKKFRNLAVYYYNRIHVHGEQKNAEAVNNFGRVVTSSIIREWPVEIKNAENEKETLYVWDRAPLSVSLKLSSVRKPSDQYVMRVLALQEGDIGGILVGAYHETLLLPVDADDCEKESAKEMNGRAVVIEPLLEGTRNKEEISSDESSSRSRKAKRKEMEETCSKNFRDGFTYPAGDSFYSFRGKKRDDYTFGATNNKSVAFIIRNISIYDDKYRDTVAQRYFMESHFAFEFANSLHIKTENYNNHVRSMSFEAASNASTHWEKSMGAIWNILYEYFERREQLTETERTSKGEILIWAHVKDMVINFINCRSKFDVRKLSNAELRTVTRMILGIRLSRMNDSVTENQGLVKKKNSKSNSKEWMLNEPERKEKVLLDMGIQEAVEIEEGKTFTQTINKLFSRLEPKKVEKMRLTDFENHIMDLSRDLPLPLEGTSVYSWLHGVSEMVAGSCLHKNPRLSVKMFNNCQITLNYEESAYRIIDHHISVSRNKMSTTSIVPPDAIMLRVHEKDNCSLTIHFIRPTSVQNESNSRQYGLIDGKSLKEYTEHISATTKPSQLEIAIREGIVYNKDKKLRGMYAYLKTGYLRTFGHILEVNPTNDQRRTITIRNLYNSGEEDNTAPVYPVNINPAELEKNQINPIIGPITIAEQSTRNDERYSMAPTVVQMMGNVTIGSSNTSNTRKKTKSKKASSSASPGSMQQQKKSPFMQLDSPTTHQLQISPPIQPMMEFENTNPTTSMWSATASTRTVQMPESSLMQQPAFVQQYPSPMDMNQPPYSQEPLHHMHQVYHPPYPSMPQQPQHMIMQNATHLGQQIQQPHYSQQVYSNYQQAHYDGQLALNQPPFDYYQQPIDNSSHSNFYTNSGYEQSPQESLGVNNEYVQDHDQANHGAHGSW